MNNTELKIIIEKVIKEVAQAQKIELPPLRDSLEVVDDLGFTSLSVASLIANMEEILGVDPFQDENVMITDIRTIKDICEVYAACLEKSGA